MEENQQAASPQITPVNPKHTQLMVDVGVEARTFAAGDFLNAIDEVVCYFEASREITEGEIARALRMYADGMGIV